MNQIDRSTFFCDEIKIEYYHISSIFRATFANPHEKQKYIKSTNNYLTSPQETQLSSVVLLSLQMKYYALSDICPLVLQSKNNNKKCK